MTTVSQAIRNGKTTPQQVLWEYDAVFGVVPSKTGNGFDVAKSIDGGLARLPHCHYVEIKDALNGAMGQALRSDEADSGRKVGLVLSKEQFGWLNVDVKDAHGNTAKIPQYGDHVVTGRRTGHTFNIGMIWK